MRYIIYDDLKTYSALDSPKRIILSRGPSSNLITMIIHVVDQSSDCWPMGLRSFTSSLQEIAKGLFVIVTTVPRFVRSGFRLICRRIIVNEIILSISLMILSPIWN